MSSVINLKHAPTLRALLARHPVQDAAVLIDRRTPWGNPFRIGPGQDRARATARYRADLWRRIRAGEIDLEALAALHGRRLACWCAPLPCHGHVLARAAAWAARQLADGGAS